MPSENKINWKNDIISSLIKGIILSAVGILVAFFWEFFKFKREIQFSKKIELIIENRRLVSDIYIETDQIRRQIKSNEINNQNSNNSNCDPGLYKDYIERLKSLPLRLNYVEELNKNIINSDSINVQVSLFKTQMKDYIICIQGNTICEICSDKFPSLVAPLEKIIELHTNEIVDLVK